MVNKYEADVVWSAFAQVVKGFIPSQEERIAKAWADMAKHSSQKDLLLQKQRNLSARYRAL